MAALSSSSSSSPPVSCAARLAACDPPVALDGTAAPEHLASLWKGAGDVFRHEWPRAYPVQAPTGGPSPEPAFPPVVVANSTAGGGGGRRLLLYVNAMESVASSMETSVLAAQNAARTVLQQAGSD